ncbi:MAG: prepilin-type N-terminal cleavage/methylation domain-containing protein [Ignavibacteriales bacterium]|nr:prepilin-type N-terminal cleavage/methylation domain-containing protein [Ignavibacteriales bacterium]
MVLLKNQDGYSLIESLVSIVLLGLIVVFSTMAVTGLFTRPKILLKGEACLMAEQEINYSLKYHVTTDTTYTNETGNLIVTRTTTPAGNLANIQVEVVYKGNHEKIAMLSVTDYR